MMFRRQEHIYMGSISVALFRTKFFAPQAKSNYCVEQHASNTVFFNRLQEKRSPKFVLFCVLLLDFSLLLTDFDDSIAGIKSILK